METLHSAEALSTGTACFHSALHGVARSRKVVISDSSVGSRGRIGPNDESGGPR